MCSSTVCRSDSAARKTSSAPQPIRSARKRIWPADSSPETYSARRPDSAQRCATLSSSVDFPTPGSPASSVTEPGTTPPPSTRSSSPKPVERCRLTLGSMEVIGTAWEANARPDRRPPPTALSAATSSTLPQVPHSRHRPTHFAVMCRHSEQRYWERAVATP